MDKLEELAAAEAGETEPDPAPEAPAEETAPPEPETLYAGKYKTPEELAVAYQHVNAEASRMAQELARARQPQPAPQQQQSEGYTQEQMNEWFDTDPAGATLYLSRIAASEALAAQNRQLEPIISSVHDQNARSVWNQLVSDYGAETVEANKEALAALIQQDPNFYSEPGTQLSRLRMALDSHLYRSRPAQPSKPQPQRDQQGRFTEGVHMEGGSTPAPSRNADEPEVDPMIQAMREAAPRSDVFGPISQ